MTSRTRRTGTDESPRHDDVTPDESAAEPAGDSSSERDDNASPSPPGPDIRPAYAPGKEPS